MQRSFFNSLALSIVVAGSLFILLWFSVSTCVAFASTFSTTEELPNLQAIIPFTNTLSPFHVSVIPGDYAYITEEFGQIFAVDGTQLVTIIPLPPGDQFSYYFGGVALHPRTKVRYIPNGAYDSLYVIQGTEMITVLRNIGDGPKAAGINPNTGLVYVGNSGDPLGITVINGSAVVTRLATSFPNVIAADPNNEKVYV